MSRGIVGAFETWKVGIPYPCMTGDIASTAELTVHEPDDGVVHFSKWRPFDQHAVSRSADLAHRARIGRRLAAAIIARSSGGCRRASSRFELQYL
jgi:hypothetical protein